MRTAANNHHRTVSDETYGQREIDDYDPLDSREPERSLRVHNTIPAARVRHEQWKEMREKTFLVFFTIAIISHTHTHTHVFPVLYSIFL